MYGTVSSKTQRFQPPIRIGRGVFLETELLESVLIKMTHFAFANSNEFQVRFASAGLAPAGRHLTATQFDNSEARPTRPVRVDECLKTSIHPDKPSGENQFCVR